MKSWIWVLTFVAMLTTAQAFAGYTDTNDVAVEQPAWKKVSTTVKVTVKRWYDYWTAGGQPRTPAPAPQQEVARPAQPAGEPAAEAAASESPAAAEQPAAVAQPETPAAKPEPIAEKKPAKPEANEEQKALRNQPLFAEKADGSSLKDVQALRKSVQGANILGVAKPGRAGTSKLEKTKAGVPTVDFKKMKVSKRIPKLDIGTENTISSADFKVEKLSWGLQKPTDLKRLPGPAPVSEKEVRNLLAKPFVKALGTKGLQANLRPGSKPVTREIVDKIQYTITAPNAVKELPYKPLSEEHLKMVAALMLFEKGGSCHIIMGLFNQLAKAPATQDEATYHLGACAHQLGMHQAAFDNLSKLVEKEDKEFAVDALTLLAKNLPIIYEKNFYKMLKGTKAPKALVTDANRDNVTYRMAKGAYRSGDFKTSLLWGDQVSEKYEFHEDARFLSAMNSFALNDKPSALKKLEGLWKAIEARKASDSNIRALTSVNLARMYFAAKKYDKALEHYQQVPKNHTLWVNALIEQGWTQLAMEDYSGAIGNMYSLHSPYFKAVYQPESFVVRTIGYLNICQYGDAYKTLSWLEKDYREWNDKTVAFFKTKGQPLTVYNTVKTYIRGKSDQSIDGVPAQVWREMARKKEFLNLQTALNEKQDEAQRYEGVNEKIKTEKASIRVHAESAKKGFDKWKNAITRAKASKETMKHIAHYNEQLRTERDRTIGYRYKLTILEQSRQGYLEFQKKSQGKLDSETVALSTKAGESLLTRANQIKTEMARVLENNEFLRYEVFAGSGENIRFQVAGGEVSGQVNRVPANVKPTKMMNWSFDGEFWEDEIGSYRSGLQNNCPVSQAKFNPEDQEE